MLGVLLSWGYWFHGAPSLAEDKVVHEQEAVQIVVPAAPLAYGSFQVKVSGKSRFADWTEADHANCYELVQKVIQYWRHRGITDYFLYGKESDEAPFAWEIIPFSKGGCLKAKQFGVWRAITFGPSALSEEKRDKVASELQEEISAPFERVETVEKVSKDAFCNKQVIECQLVDDPQNGILLLHDYKPLKEWHFLAIPSKHRDTLADATQKEFVQLMIEARKVTILFKKEGYSSCTFFCNNGVIQSVKHLHLHILPSDIPHFTDNLKFLKNMAIGSAPLSQKALQKRIALSKEKFQNS